MEEIGQRSYPMLYGPTAPHSRHPSGCLRLGSFMANLATSPIELEHRAYWAIKKLNLSFDQAGKEKLLQLQELQELRNESYQNAEIYKAKNKAFHDKHINRKTFHVHNKAWLYNSHLKLFAGKLRSRWDGPYEILQVFHNGSVLILDPKTKNSFMENGHRLKTIYW